MLIPFLALQAYLSSAMPVIQTIKVWNNNMANILAGTDDPYALPAIFIEFPDNIKWDQLGNGVQIVDPLEVSFHLVTDFYDAMDGTKDNNLATFQMADNLRNVLQDWMPTTFTISPDGEYGAYAGTYQAAFGAFCRSNEIQDKNHTNVYHFIQSYMTTWVDSARSRPIGGSTAGNLNYELDKVLPWADDGFYTAQQYVSYQDGIYKCILDTTSAHEPPTNETYFIKQ